MSRRSITSDVFAAIAEPRRREIIDLLERQRNLAVGAIVVALGLPQPAVSKHLHVLRAVGIVFAVKQGQQRVYALNPAPLRPVYDWVKAYERHWSGQLDRIRSRAEQRAADLSGPAQQSSGQQGPVQRGPADHLVPSASSTRKKGKP